MDTINIDILNEYMFLHPDAAHLEKNYLHHFDGISQGFGYVYNKELEGGFGVSVKFNTKCLPYLTHWKMEGVRDYVLALEPCNAPCLSRKKLREEGMLPFLLPGESVTNELEIEVITGKS